MLYYQKGLIHYSNTQYLAYINYYKQFRISNLTDISQRISILQKLILKMNQYQIISKLGQGAFASVYKVKRKQDQTEYALKRIRINSLSQKEITNCLNQVRILASINNSYIIDYKDSFYDEISKSFCIVTQFLEGGDLSHFIKRHKLIKKIISENKIWAIAVQCLKGLSSLHSQQIFHRDIKPANILVTKDNKTFKLADMNVSKISQNGMAKTQTGTPYYASPQVWKQSQYTSKCDIWSLGCVLYQMTTFKPPFNSQDLKGLKKNIIKGQYKPIPSYYSTQLKQFIAMCLVVDHTKRSSANQLLESSILKQAMFWKLEINPGQESPKLDMKVQLLDKIQAPKKRDFFRIREHLPKNRFKSQQNKAVKTIENNENQINESNIQSTRIKRKTELPPMMKKSSNQTGRNQKHIKFLQQRIVNLCDDALMSNYPPLYKNSKQLR